MAETILVADDDVGVRESLAEVLRDAGYAVQTAVDGTAALAALDMQDFVPEYPNLERGSWEVAEYRTVLRRCLRWAAEVSGGSSQREAQHAAH